MRTLIFISLIALLSSCKTETSKTWRIYNSTSGNIQAQIKDFSTNQLETYTLAPEENVLIKSTTVKSRDEGGDPGDAFSSLVITNSVGDTCLKNFNVADDWEIMKTTKSPPMRLYLNYNFWINDSDF